MNWEQAGGKYRFYFQKNQFIFLLNDIICGVKIINVKYDTSVCVLSLCICGRAECLVAISGIHRRI